VFPGGRRLRQLANDVDDETTHKKRFGTSWYTFREFSMGSKLDTRKTVSPQKT